MTRKQGLLSGRARHGFQGKNPASSAELRIRDGTWRACSLVVLHIPEGDQVLPALPASAASSARKALCPIDGLRFGLREKGDPDSPLLGLQAVQGRGATQGHGRLPDSGRSRHWIKSKNQNAPAVRREARRTGESGDNFRFYCNFTPTPS